MRRRRDPELYELTDTPYIITFEERTRLVIKAIREGGSVSIAVIASTINEEIADVYPQIGYDDIALAVRKLVESGEVIKIAGQRRDYFMIAPIVEYKRTGKRPGRRKSCKWRNGGIVQ
jgi:hypothetical protein